MPHADERVLPNGYPTVSYHAGGKPGSRPILTGPLAKPTFTSIPLIDMSAMFSHSLSSRQKLAAEVGKACRDVGFFYAQNHNIPDSVISSTFEAIEAFFALPHEEKMETHINKSAHFRGYEPLFETKLDPETRGDMKESFTMGEDATDPEQHGYNTKSGSVGVKKNNWPKSNPEFREALYAYYTHVFAFSRALLHIFALALELPETSFDDMCSFPMTAIRALHYPPQDACSSDVGIGAHTDYCWFTLVCQSSVSALQVLNDNGIWVDAPPLPRTFVVNIGDFLSLASAGLWQSTVHRVVNLTGERRCSLPFFFSPNEDARVGVLERFRKEGEVYQEVGVGDYFRGRLFEARYKHPTVVKWTKEKGRGERGTVEGSEEVPVAT